MRGDNVMYDMLLFGILLGLAAGFSPGPLLVLVVSETLRHGVWAGLRASLAPLVTDLPIIAITLVLMDALGAHPAVLGALSLAGGVFVMYLGIGSMRTRGVTVGEGVEVARPLGKAVTVNALSPHPYIFWLTVGGPIVIKSAGQGYAEPAAFIAGFYVFLVGSKMALAALAGVTRGRLTGAAYVAAMRVLGGLLVLFSLLLFRDGLKMMGWIY
jgi:threonine/homoserine/homoserine lactone efflux protein